MKKIISSFLVIVLLFSAAAVLASCGKQTPKSIIYMIGDGMGQNHIDWAENYCETDFNLQSKKFVRGTARTASLTGEVTDSAAGGTALATGCKTKNQLLGFTYDGWERVEAENLCEAARKQGKSVGILTTDALNGATPAAFSCHGLARTETERIFEQQIDFAPEVFLGAAPTDVDVNDFDRAGYTVVTNLRELLQTDTQSTEKLIGFFNFDDLYAGKTEVTPSLQDMMRVAIEILSADEDGFFLMVEGACIDKASHSNDFKTMAMQLNEFDKCVGDAMAYCSKNSAAVVITADHETGGLNAFQKDATHKFASGGHTGADVPVLAYGKGVGKQFGGKMENTDVAKQVAALMGLETFGSLKPQTEKQ